MIRDVRIALAVGLSALLIGLCVVALQHPAAVAGTNGASAEDSLGNVEGYTKLCEIHESIPPGTTALVLSLSAVTGPRLTVQVISNGVTVSRGTRASGWAGRGVVVSLDSPIRRSIEGKVCFEVTPKDEHVYVFGSQRSGEAHGHGRAMRIEYLRRSSSTWLSRSARIARNLGRGRAPSGSWAPVVVIMLGLAVIAGAAGLVSSGLR